MNNKTLIFIQYSLIVMVVYITVLFIQWTYETKYTFTVLLEDIVAYDTQVLNEANNDKANIKEYGDLFIAVENVDGGVWLSKWNIFDWSETKYIKEEHRQFILLKLNYWRQTGKLPSLYNLNIKSTFNFGGNDDKNNS